MKGPRLTRQQDLTRRHRRGGFTLVELGVVIAIGAMITALTVTGFRNLTYGNRRVTCQGNLRQIYQSLRLYQQDESGNVPPYNAAAGLDKDRGIGLWALYTYQTGVDPLESTIAPVEQDLGGSVTERTPVGRYLRNVNVLHCPMDYRYFPVDPDTDPDFARSFSSADLHRWEKRYSSNPDDAVFALNAEYLSYQQLDPNDSASTSIWDRTTYQTVRTVDSGNSNWKRQLQLYTSGSVQTPGGEQIRPPRDDTIITWCFFHRRTPGNGSQWWEGMDNVLFYDGTVRTMPRQQVVEGNDLDYWRRVPQGTP